MERLYYQNPYVKSFEAIVESCTEEKGGTYEVVLNRTAFYPEGGGQPFDLGTLGTAKVTAVHEKDGVIYHETDVYCKPGDTLTGILDWERRYSYMQQHSGEHLLSGLIHKHYGYDNVGFHMGREEITIDFNGILTPEQVEELELEANRMIYANLSITETYPLPEELAHLPY
ncbi:MAG: alanyl-tRNA editing protein, partial [Hungatella sp.]